MDCLFCKIANKEIDSDIIYQDDQVIAFNDITPQAPHHVLIIPRKHISTMNDLTGEDSAILGQMMLTSAQLAKQLNISEPGYRVLMNCNADGGQAVFHIHLHLLGGRRMQWPPG